MEKFKTFCKKYTFEIIFLVVSLAALITSSIVFKSHVLVLICTTLGLVGSVLNSKGNALCYMLAMTSSITYGIVSLEADFIGEVILHWGFLVPLYIYSLIKWLKPNKNKKSIVRPVFSLNKEKTIFLTIIALIVVGVYGVVLKYLLKSDFPFLNAASTVCLLFANLLGAKRVRQQWYVHMIGNIVLITLWLLKKEQGNYPIFIQNVLFFIINIRGVILWTKLSKTYERSIEPSDC